MTASSGKLVQTGDPLIDEARDRFNLCAEWESTARERFIQDLKFRHGDSDNGYQWPNSIRRARDVDSKPTLTINQIRQHNLQIINDAKQNKSSVRILATGNGSTRESALCLMDIIRNIEYHSDAQDAYQTAIEFQVDGGIGWWRIVTDYAGPETFEQEVFVRRVSDPLSVYLDPDIQTKDGSDAKFAFVFDDVPREEFEKAYPNFKDIEGQSPLGTGSTQDDWMSDSHVRVCEYFRKVPKRDKLYEFVDPKTGQRRTIRDSRMPKAMRDAVIDHPLTRSRTVEDEVVEWYLIVGEKKVDSTTWPGRYIPLVRCVGEEIVLDGVLDRKGHTRALKDAQRMYNYNASSQVEFVALQGKTPWVAPAAAIEELETMWNTANTVNHSVLPWKHIDDEGNPIPPPQRPNPPNMSPAYQEGMNTAFQQLMMASGQWQNQLGMMGNERTGSAIEKRQHQSDTAVFHFQDNYATALRFTGKQLIDLIPKIYDTRRIKRIMADDGVEYEVEIDPTARAAYLQEMGHEGEIIRRIFNPQLGQYDVQAAVGPAYGTKREQTVEALTLILTQAPALTGIIGDLLLQSMDFDKADEAAQRLKRMVPPQALGKGPTQQEQLLTTQVQSLSAALMKALDNNAKDKIKLQGKDQMRDIDAYKAETDRFKALSDALMIDQGGITQVIEQLVQQSLQTQLTPIVKANAKGISGDQDNQLVPSGTPDSNVTEVPPVPGARKAPDGEWYITDPTRKGKYLRVAPLAQEHAPRGVIANG